MTRRRSILLGLLGASALAWAGCRERRATRPTTQGAPGAEARFERRRADMIRSQLAGRDITHPRVLEAMARVPRHRFVAPGLASRAYDDRPLPIGGGQTISQPYIVALMTQLADPRPGDRVLDIGTGSGYQAAVLAEMGAEVSSIEIVPALAAEAADRLRALKYDAVEVRAGDGYQGWPEKAPFQAILLAAAAPEVPRPLLDQLAPGGRLVLPVGDRGAQDLLVITKQPDGRLTRQGVVPVRFVPMTGEVRNGRPDGPAQR
jgi:protein-L-isoaspartate(D-aspartate) O-methyltransferase